MNSGKIRITVPKPQGQCLLSTSTYNIELLGFTLQLVSHNLISFGGETCCGDLFKVLDRGYEMSGLSIDVYSSVESELCDLDVVSFIVFLESEHDARVLIITKDTEETILANQLKKLP
ncbi:hypothetical protein GCM10023213_08130 [Prosthecobacter algae]|uniref:Uncharacterized protein n=1 Tax=Prosthecobacter algae TaxID=1144682 RepID=A0ABP9NVL2_9BACT